MKEELWIDGELYESETIEDSRPPVKDESTTLRFICVLIFGLLICLLIYFIKPVTDVGRSVYSEIKTVLGIKITPTDISHIKPKMGMSGLAQYTLLTDKGFAFDLNSVHSITPDIGVIKFRDGTIAVFSGEYEISIDKAKVSNLATVYRDQQSLDKDIKAAVRKALRIAANGVTYAEIRKQPNKLSAELNKSMALTDLPAGITYSITLTHVTVGDTEDE